MKRKSSDIDRVRKLLSLFDSAKGTAEGDNAHEKAKEILDRHGWKEHEVRDEVRKCLASDADEWRKMLAVIVAERFHVEIIEDDNGVYFQGLSAAVDDASRLFSRLESKISEEAREFAADMADRGRAGVLLNGFAMNAVLALFERIVNVEAKKNELMEKDRQRMNYEMSGEGSIPENHALTRRIEKAFEESIDQMTEDELEFCVEGQLLGQRIPLTGILTRTVAGALPMRD